MWNQFDEFPNDVVGDGGALGVAQDQAIQVDALSLAQYFVVKEKEGAILAASDDRAAFSESRQVDWAADCAAELIALEGRRPRRGEVKKVTRIKRIVPEEFIQLAMELLCAGARGDVDDCPTVAAILGAEGRVIYLELPDTGERRVEEEKVDELIVDSNAVDLEVDRFLSIARGIEAQRTTTAGRRRKEAVLRRRYGTGSEESQVSEVTTVERNLLRRSLVNYLTH